MNKCSNFILFLSTLCIATSILSCSSKKQISTAKLKKKTSKFIIESTNKNQLRYNWISSKISCLISAKNKNTDLNVKLRMKKDSAIWLSISPALGIEMARVLITPDSVKYVNRLEKTYYMGTTKKISSLSPIPVNYFMLQNFISGTQDIQFDKKQNENMAKFKANVDNKNYLLSTINKKAHQKSIEGKKHKDVDALFFWISPNTFKFQKIEEINYTKNQKIIIEYNKYESIDNQNFPTKGKLTYEDDSSFSLTLEYYKTELNNPQKMPFSISQKYERIH